MGAVCGCVKIQESKKKSTTI